MAAFLSLNGSEVDAIACPSNAGSCSEHSGGGVTCFDVDALGVLFPPGSGLGVLVTDHGGLGGCCGPLVGPRAKLVAPQDFRLAHHGLGVRVA